jgi:5-methyltetrahydropteroyltriglutamate--homocysteine methyltransferase
MSVTRADVVGSLLRPQQLLAARQRQAAGELTPAEFKQIEDRAVDAGLALQRDVGLEVATDGEMRRLSFQSQVTEALAGFGAWDLDAFVWGDWRGDAEVGDCRIDRPELAVTERLRRRRSPTVEEFVYARARTEATVKVTLPSPSLFANFWDPRASTAAYPSLEAFLGDVAELLREEVDELTALGCASVQLDAPHYTLLLDPAYRDFYEQRGWSAQRFLELGVELDNAVVGGRTAVTVAFHLCRGNQAGRWLVEGGYEALAPVLFSRVAADRLMLEYDDARSGSFAPLAHVPDDRVAVLGLVTTKRARLESVAWLRACLDEAARVCPLERLAVSPQCGFATSVLGSGLAEADQRAKLARVVEVAGAVWG